MILWICDICAEFLLPGMSHNQPRCQEKVNIEKVVNEPSWQVYLLAAGQGRRAGGPKAWRPCGGAPLLQRQVSFLRSRFAPRSIAVSIQPSWDDRCKALDPEVRWVTVLPEASPLGALQALLKAVPMEVPSFLYHVDMRVWQWGVFDALQRGLEEHEAAVPSHGGKRGHPVLLAASLAPAISALEPGRERLDVFLRGRRVVEVPAAFGCIHDNWNEAEAVRGR